jgi:N-acetylglucosaminyldiphosphoundecaprenol N-acetyl-beta-D-mannosaminyltransferase
MGLGANRVTKRIISLNIDEITYDEAIHRIISIAQQKSSGYICFANVHMTIEAYQNKKFAEQVNDAELVLADGMPLVQTMNLLHGCRQERIAGMDAFPDLIRLAEAHGVKIFFFGSTRHILDKIRLRAQRDFPALKIAGFFSPPFDQSLDDPSYVDLINSAQAQMVFVALGCPKQEKWMATHSHKIHAVLLGVGGAFPVYAEMQARAPLLMRKLSLEWLFRLFQEPRRLYSRYLTTNTMFILLIIKSFCQLSYPGKKSSKKNTGGS